MRSSCLSLEASFQRLLPQQLLCQQSICCLGYGAAFQTGLPSPQENFDAKFRGARALSSVTPPPAASGSFPGSSLARTPPGAEVGRGAAGSRPGSGRGARGKEASWRNRRGQMPWGLGFVPAGRMLGANCLITQEQFLRGPPCHPMWRDPPIVCHRWATLQGRERLAWAWISPRPGLRSNF